MLYLIQSFSWKESFFMSSVVVLLGMGVPTPQLHDITHRLRQEEPDPRIVILSGESPSRRKEAEDGLPVSGGVIWDAKISFAETLHRAATEYPDAVVVFADEPTDADSVRTLARAVDVTQTQIAVGISGQPAPKLFRALFRIGAGISLPNPCSRLLAFSPKALQISGTADPTDSVQLLTQAKSLGISLATVSLPQTEASAAPKPPLRLYFRFLFHILKFAGSSFFCYGLELLLYSILYTLWAKKSVFAFGGTSFSEAIGNPAMLGSFLIARFLSACLNFILNRNVVFRSRGKLGRALGSYALLVLFVAAATYLLLGIFSFLGVSGILAHPLSTILMFFVSYTVQRKLIF